jgi:hypothetical protein
MKSRELLTTPVLVVTNYKIVSYAGGKFLHSFTPESTSTVYQFIANKEPVLEAGHRYNVGYTTDGNVNWVDIAATAKADDVDKNVSYYVSKALGNQLRAVETKKSDERVKHSATDGHYLGKKYAWRIYGMVVARDTFEDYLKEINHPAVACLTDDNPSIAYKEDGIEKAMDALIQSAQRIAGQSNRFTSPLLPSREHFQIKGISAITDKK